LTGDPLLEAVTDAIVELGGQLLACTPAAERDVRP
jgi:hypothetical protein